VKKTDHRNNVEREKRAAEDAQKQLKADLEDANRKKSLLKRN